MKKLLLTVIQIALLFIFARLINWVTAALHINIPGSIIGIVILFTLLHFKIIKLEWIELGAAWLLGELLLFFIPSAVGVIEYGDIMSKFGVSILLVVVISTFVVMVSTGTLTRVSVPVETITTNVLMTTTSKMLTPNLDIISPYSITPTADGMKNSSSSPRSHAAPSSIHSSLIILKCNNVKRITIPIILPGIFI